MPTQTHTPQKAHTISIATTAPQVSQQFHNSQSLENISYSNIFKMIGICYSGLFFSFGSIILIAYSVGYPITW